MPIENGAKRRRPKRPSRRLEPLTDKPSVAAARAESPAEISQRGWRDVLARSLRSLFAEETALSAAGIAFYIVWALLPALAVVVIAVARLLGNAPVVRMLSWLHQGAGESLQGVVVAQLDAIARNSGLLPASALLAGVALAVWGGMRGANGLMTALNAVYRQPETRSIRRRAAVAFGLALVGGLFLTSALAMIVAGAVTALSAIPSGAVLLAPSRWPVLIIAMLLLLALAYRYAPSRPLAKWRWVTWGATLSAAIWVVGSFVFAYVAGHIVDANPLLGSLASVVAFLFWIYLTVLVVLLGAHINAELEHHTVSDTRAEAQSERHSKARRRHK